MTDDRTGAAGEVPLPMADLQRRLAQLTEDNRRLRQANTSLVEALEQRPARQGDDVTENLRTRECLRTVTEEANLLALIARHLENAVFVLGPDGRIEWVNDAFCRTTGHPREDVIGANPGRIARSLTGDLDWGDLGARLETERTVEIETTAVRKDGTPYWIDLQIQLLHADGLEERLLGVLRDVTNRRETEERITAAHRRAEHLAGELSAEKTLLSDVLRSIPHPVYWKDRDLRYAGVNAAFLRVRGCSRGAELLGLRETEIVIMDSLREVLPFAERRVLASRRPVESLRVSIPAAAGPPRQLLLSVLPQVDSQGAVYGVIGVAADVTQVRQLERQLALANRLESIGQLAAGIAHEINTPVQFVSDNTRFVTECCQQIIPALRRLQGHARGTDGQNHGLSPTELAALLDTLDLDFIAEEMPVALSQSLEGLDRVTNIVRAMKDFSHPGGERTNTDLNRAVESTVQVTHNEWKYVADCVTSLHPEVGAVPCYEGEIKQAVLNLIVNAAQAIGEKQERTGSTRRGRITVRTRRVRDTVTIEVADDGPGMTAEVRARIFDPFFTTKPVGRGTGQGLSMVHATIVQKHHGAIEVRSRPGEGAQFVIALPAPRARVHQSVG